MIKNHNKNNTRENTLYNNILLLSRNKLFFTEFGLSDTFQNRIYLIFIHTSFLLNKIKIYDQSKKYKVFYQKMFDLVFNNIELNMREVGYGDTIINKNMKFLVKNFYNILLNCENFRKKNTNSKKMFFLEYLKYNDLQKKPYNTSLIGYFDQYQAFCFDLNHDSVLRDGLKFKYK